MEASNKVVSKKHRYYGSLISSLKIMRGIGIFGAVIWGCVASLFGIVLGLITFITSAFTTYISITTCIAIIDLLSKIEHNTRKLEQ